MIPPLSRMIPLTMRARAVHGSIGWQGPHMNHNVLVKPIPAIIRTIPLTMRMVPVLNVFFRFVFCSVLCVIFSPLQVRVCVLDIAHKRGLLYS